MKKLKDMKTWQKIVIIAVIAVAAAFLLEIIQIKTQPLPVVYSYSEEPEEQETVIYPDLTSGIFHYDEVENGLQVTGGDPQLYFSVAGMGTISSINFRFSSPLTEEIRIQIFYPDENGGYSEGSSIASNCPAGSEFWSFEIPEAEYTNLRIDIDGDFIPLKSITATNAVAIRIPQPAKIHPLRVLIIAAVLFALLLWAGWIKAWSRMKAAFRGGFQALLEDKKKTVLRVVLFGAIAGITAIIFWLICSKINQHPMTPPRIVFALALGFFTACLLSFRKTLKTQPEYLFLILVLCTGFLYCFYLPHTGVIGWDEDFHFRNALSISYVDSTMMTQQDEITINRNIYQSYDLNGGVQKIHDRQDRLYQSGAVEQPDTVSVKGVPGFANGIGLFIGRALGLRYYMIHFMGRFLGLMIYAFLGFFAIRKLKSGKMIAAVCLLIPTEVFIASCYNYDAYLTGFTALGLCYYIAQWQDPKAKITLKDAIIMVGSITFGCMTKQIYISLLWILVILPKEKFTDQKHRIWFILSMVFATGLIVLTYVAPAWVEGIAPMTEVDDRGGADISIGRQLAYIAAHPLDYAGVVWRYTLYSYFNLERVGDILTYIGYLGRMPNQYLYLMLLAVVAFTDKNEHDKGMMHRPLAHIWPIFISFVTIGLIITSLYLMFTPVGSEQVNGAQYRYLIPLFLPVLMHIGPATGKNQYDRGRYNGIVLGVAAYVEFACVYNALITLYY